MLLLAIPDSLINGSKDTRLLMPSRPRRNLVMGERRAWKTGSFREEYLLVPPLRENDCRKGTDHYCQIQD